MRRHWTRSFGPKPSSRSFVRARVRSNEPARNSAIRDQQPHTPWTIECTFADTLEEFVVGDEIVKVQRLDKDLLWCKEASRLAGDAVLALFRAN